MRLFRDFSLRHDYIQANVCFSKKLWICNYNFHFNRTNLIGVFVIIAIMNVSKYCADPGKSRDRQITSESDNGDFHNSGNSHKKVNRKILLTLLILIAVMVAVGLLMFVPLINKKATHTAIIKIPAKATMDQVHDSISKYLGDDYATDVCKAMRITGSGDEIRHGAWRINQGETPFRAARTLTDGGQVGIRVTLQNERTPQDVARRLSAKLDLPEEEMLKLFGDADFLKDYNCDPEHAMIFFLADTYEFYWTASAKDVFDVMYKNYRRFWTPERVSAAEDLHLSPREVVTLASIVDEETNQNGEKGMIGRLYINRLEQEMKLQADPTVKYAIGDFSIRRITGDMLKTPSPYNTYMNEGLPPGPIRITSGATIDAILTARPHDYIYMCAKEDFSGSHNFAQTYEEHKVNAKHYQEALDKRGIK